MITISPEIVFSALLELFAEAYEGPQHPFTWFNESRPGSGILDRIATLTAAQASQATAESGPTIAAHVEHLRWSLALANSVIQGGDPNQDWEQSWSVRVVDGSAWDKLQRDLRSEYDQIRAAIAAQEDWSIREYYIGTLSLLPHAAYHLGAIAELIRRVQ